jgi:hypothetical protein
MVGGGATPRRATPAVALPGFGCLRRPARTACSTQTRDTGPKEGRSRRPAAARRSQRGRTWSNSTRLLTFSFTLPLLHFCGRGTAVGGRAQIAQQRQAVGGGSNTCAPRSHTATAQAGRHKQRVQDPDSVTRARHHAGRWGPPSSCPCCCWPRPWPWPPSTSAPWAPAERERGARGAVRALCRRNSGALPAPGYETVCSKVMCSWRTILSMKHR